MIFGKLPGSPSDDIRWSSERHGSTSTRSIQYHIHTENLYNVSLLKYGYIVLCLSLQLHLLLL